MEKIKEKSPFELDVVSVRLVKDAPIISDEPLNNPDKVIKAVGSFLSELDREALCVINLKSNLAPINMSVASMGTLNYAVFHPRELLKAAILSNAAYIMLAHNHPSGNIAPSEEDVRITDRMNQICRLMDIPLIEHIIIGDNRYFSFNQHEMLQQPELKFETDYTKIEMQRPRQRSR